MPQMERCGDCLWRTQDWLGVITHLTLNSVSTNQRLGEAGLCQSEALSISTYSVLQTFLMSRKQIFNIQRALWMKRPFRFSFLEEQLEQSNRYFFCMGQYECSLLRHLGECWYLNAMFVCRLDQFKLTIKFYEIQIYKYTEWKPNNWQFLTCTYLYLCIKLFLEFEFVQFCFWVGVRVIIPANLSRVCPLFYLQIYRAWNITLGQVRETFTILALEYFPCLIFNSRIGWFLKVKNCVFVSIYLISLCNFYF